MLKEDLLNYLRSLDPVAIADLTQEAYLVDHSVPVIYVRYMRDADTVFIDYSVQEIIAVVNESEIRADDEYLCRNLVTGDWYSFNEEAMEDDMMSEILYSLVNCIVESGDDLGDHHIAAILDSNLN